MPTLNEQQPPMVADDLQEVGASGNFAPGRKVSYNSPPTANIVDDQPISSGVRGGAERAPDLFTRILSAQNERSLSSDGSKYLKDLTDLTTAKGLKCTRLPKTSGYLFHNDSIGVVLMFAEHHTATRNFSPVSKGGGKIITEANEVIPTVNTLDFIVVSIPDYACVGKMAQHLERTIKYGLTNVMQFEELNAPNVNFRINNNLNSVMRHMDMLSPHAVPSYAQYGIALEMCSSENYNPRRNEDYDWVPIFAITGYNDYEIKPIQRRGGYEFLPLVHVNEPVASIPSMFISPLIMATVYQFFIGYELWKTAYTDFSGRQPNIGSLIMDQDTGKPALIKSATDQEVFMNETFSNPVLMWDIQEGRGTIPGMNLLIDPSSREIAKSIMVQFFGGDERVANALGTIMYGCAYEEYTGLVVDGGVNVDSRSIDYFKIVDTIRGESNFAQKFLCRSPEPESRLLDIQDAGFQQITPLYSNWMCFPDVGDLQQITELIAETFIPNMDEHSSRQSMFGHLSASLGDRFAEPFINGGSIFRNRSRNDDRNRGYRGNASAFRKYYKNY